VTGRWFSSGSPVSSTIKSDCHDITEILLKMSLNTINQTEPNRVMKRLYIYILPLSYAILDYNSIELLCFHYNGSTVVYFFTSTVHCFGRFFGKSFGLMDCRTIERSDDRAFGLLGYRIIGQSDYRADTMCLNWWHNYMCIMKWRIHSNKTIKETRKERADYF
jgi:hypothetical protein